MSRRFTYKIEQGEEVQRVEGRAAAVSRARAISRSTHRPVSLEREDRRMQMTWRRGALQQYRLDTR